MVTSWIGVKDRMQAVKDWMSAGEFCGRWIPKEKRNMLIHLYFYFSVNITIIILLCLDFCPFKEGVIVILKYIRRLVVGLC